MIKNWEKVSLGEVVKVQNGFAFDSKLFSSDRGIPLIRIRDLKQGKKTAIKYFGDFDSSYLVHPGDLLVGMDGEFRCYEWSGPEALLNQRVCRLIPQAERLDSRFLKFGLNEYLKAIEAVTTFTTVKHLSSKQIKEIQFPLPPMKQQLDLVAKLVSGLTLIEQIQQNLTEQINKAESLKAQFILEAYGNSE